MKINVPNNALRVLNTLEQAGFPSYVVGGCVRDALMGRTPNDWDICTAALPQQVKELCAQAGFATFDTGIQHGTVTVHVDHEPFEVTTFRADGAYEDGRHPVSVSFLSAVEGDLARRDFTVNAMAYSPARGLVDLYGGQEDLRAGVLRCVGDPHERFAEDGLRILRALRFTSVLGFAIDPATADALHADRALLEPVAMERISAEFMKLICGRAAAEVLLDYRDVVGVFLPQVAPMFGFEQLNKYHVYDVWEHCVRACALIEPDPLLRLAALVHDIGKPSCFFTDEDGCGHFYGHPEAGEPIARELARHLRLSNAATSELCTLVLWHDRPLPLTRKSMRRRLAKLGEPLCRRLYQLVEADMRTHSQLGMADNLEKLAQSRALMEEVLQEMDVFSPRDLAVDGRDLIELGFEPGPRLGEVKDALFSLVVDGELPNSRPELLAHAVQLL
ncbi:MAG: CCA tRNA nucleotidyltransferase [Coriobacteriales bacterium]